MNELNSITVVDGSYLLHRALHLTDVFELRNSKGVRTGGIFQFLRMLNKEVKICGKTFPVVVFDMGLSKRRVDIDPEYKKATERALQDQQVLTPEESDIDYVTQYRKQRNLLSILLPYMGIPAIKFAGWEGDDLMYILSKISNYSIILTDDRDMLQLLSDKCDVRRPMADEFWKLSGFLESNGYSDISDFVIYKALLGDNSDNIPGSCDGVGKGTANDLVKLIKWYLKSFGTVSEYPKEEKALKAICEQSGAKYRKAFLNIDFERYQKNLELVDLSKVEYSDQVVNSMLATIKNSQYSENYLKSLKFLSSLEIRDFDLDELISMVKMKRKYLWKES